jgi:hypothetical protein
VPGFRTVNEAILAATLRPTGPLRPTGLSGVCSTKGLMADDSLASCGAAVTMAGPDDEDTFAERLLNFPRAIFRWASPAPRSGSRTTGSGTTGCRTTGSAAGCLNPLTLLKLLVGLLLVVLLPFYMLPLLVVRIATLGRSSIRYNSVITVTSGEQARWSYGALDAVPDLPSVQAGAAAIAAHDTEFEPDKLMNWAMATTELIRVSLISGDATPARTFMANGLFRTYLALLELRAQAEVVCEGSWHCTRATLVDALSTPLVDEVRVRLTCTGWCCDRHAPSGLALRGSPDTRTWSEDLTFGRSASAISPAAGGLPAKHCPSCGAPLDLDENGACRYCDGIVTAGRHDWVLIGWRREAS